VNCLIAADEIKRGLLGAAVAYLYQSAISPDKSDPQGRMDRALRFFGAVILTIIFIYLVGFMLRFWGTR
jgi:hypothetical protein